MGTSFPAWPLLTYSVYFRDHLINFFITAIWIVFHVDWTPSLPFYMKGSASQKMKKLITILCWQTDLDRSFAIVYCPTNLDLHTIVHCQEPNWVLLYSFLLHLQQLLCAKYMINNVSCIFKIFVFSTWKAHYDQTPTLPLHETLFKKLVRWSLRPYFVKIEISLCMTFYLFSLSTEILKFHVA